MGINQIPTEGALIFPRFERSTGFSEGWSGWPCAQDNLILREIALPLEHMVVCQVESHSQHLTHTVWAQKGTS